MRDYDMLICGKNDTMKTLMTPLGSYYSDPLKQLVLHRLLCAKELSRSSSRTALDSGSLVALRH